MAKAKSRQAELISSVPVLIFLGFISISEEIRFLISQNEKSLLISFLPVRTSLILEKRVF